MAFLINDYKVTEYIVEEKKKIFEIPFYFKDEKDIYFLINEKSDKQKSGRYIIKDNKIIFNDYLEINDILIIYRRKEIAQVVNYLSNSKINVNMLKSETENIYLIIQDIYENTMDLTDITVVTSIVNDVFKEIKGKISETEHGITYLANKYETKEGLVDNKAITPSSLEYTFDNEIKPYINSSNSLPDEVGDYFLMNKEKALKDEDLIYPLEGQIMPFGDYKLHELEGYLLNGSIENMESLSKISALYSSSSSNLISNNEYLSVFGNLYKKNNINSDLEKLIITGATLNYNYKYMLYNEEKTKLFLFMYGGSNVEIDLITNVATPITNQSENISIYFISYNLKLKKYIGLFKTYNNSEYKIKLKISEDECRNWITVKSYNIEVSSQESKIVNLELDICDDYGLSNYNNGRYYLSIPTENRICCIDENDLESELITVNQFISNKTKISDSAEFFFNSPVIFYEDFSLVNLNVNKDNTHNISYTKDGGKTWNNIYHDFGYSYSNSYSLVKFRRVQPISNNSVILLNTGFNISFFNIDTLIEKEIENTVAGSSSRKLVVNKMSNNKLNLINYNYRTIFSIIIEKTYEPSVNIKLPDFSDKDNESGTAVWALKGK